MRGTRKTRSMISNDIALRYKAIALFRAAADEVAPLVELAVCECTEKRVELCARIFRAVANLGCRSTGEWLEKLIERDDDPFSEAAARGERIADHIKAQVINELSTFKQLSLVKPGGACDCVPRFVYGGFTLDYDRLVERFAENGCGELACGNTFIYSGGKLVPTSTDSRLADLAGYTEEIAEVVRNTENFIKGLPSFHTLIYGDRGTGKSTTVRALASEFPKLKIIELDGGSVGLLPELEKRLVGRQKHIVFIDGLTVDGANAALERALDTAGENMLVYCTANRIRQPAQGGVSVLRREHGGDGDENSLMDRFGLVVTYISPDRDGFIDVLKSIVSRRGMRWREEYASIADIVALKKGGRSPRTAKQIADIIESTYAESI